MPLFLPTCLTGPARNPHFCPKNMCLKFFLFVFALPCPCFPPPPATYLLWTWINPVLLPSLFWDSAASDGTASLSPCEKSPLTGTKRGE